MVATMSSSRYTQQRQTSLSSTSFNYEITKKSYIGKITLKDKRKSENSVVWPCKTTVGEK